MFQGYRLFLSQRHPLVPLCLDKRRTTVDAGCWVLSLNKKIDEGSLFLSLNCNELRYDWGCIELCYTAFNSTSCVCLFVKINNNIKSFLLFSELGNVGFRSLSGEAAGANWQDRSR